MKLDSTSAQLAPGEVPFHIVHDSNRRTNAASMASNASGGRSRWSRWAVSTLWITFPASCQDLTPVRPPVTAADQGPVGAASELDHRGVDAVDAGAWIPRLCLV